MLYKAKICPAVLQGHQRQQGRQKLGTLLSLPSLSSLHACALISAIQNERQTSRCPS